MHEFGHRHRRRDYANEISVAADIDQADAEASIAVKEQTIVFLMPDRGRFEAINLPEHTPHPRTSTTCRRFNLCCLR